MTDKVQKIKDWISKTQNGLMDANGNFEYPEHEGAYHILCNLDTYIDSLQEEPKFKIGDVIRFKGNETLEGEKETHKIVGYDNELYIFDDGTTELFCEQELYELVKEPVSEDLEEASKNYALNNTPWDDCKDEIQESFKAGAKWQKEQMMAKAIDATCFGIQGVALFTFRLPAGSYLVGSKVKVIAIKEK